MAKRDFITIISGLPRSGTSMMMQMLAKADLDLLTDEVRTADEDNPNGYLEFERIKKIEEDDTWLSQASGQAVKMVSTLVRNLPDGYLYKIIFMRRDLVEVIKSQEKMLKRRQTQGADISQDKMRMLYVRHLQEVDQWLRSKAHIDVLYVDYSNVVASPLEEAYRVAKFLDLKTNDEGIQAMASAVDKTLYRNKASDAPETDNLTIG